MVINKLQNILAPAIDDLGYELWGIEYVAQGKHSLLRIYIDHPKGIGIEDCERVSRQVSALLDVEDPIQGHYNLEVSSPGVPRPLFYLWQYKKYIGSEIILKLSNPLNGKNKVSGTLISVNEDSVVLEVEQEQLDVLFSTIAKASLKV